MGVRQADAVLILEFELFSAVHSIFINYDLNK